jgi:hypothetical protein
LAGESGVIRWGLPGRISTRFSLRPVAFRYKKEIDPAAIQQFGLVAEDLGKVNPDLVVRDSDGKAYTVRYRANQRHVA